MVTGNRVGLKRVYKRLVRNVMHNTKNTRKEKYHNYHTKLHSETTNRKYTERTQYTNPEFAIQHKEHSRQQPETPTERICRLLETPAEQPIDKYQYLRRVTVLVRRLVVKDKQIIRDLMPFGPRTQSSSI